MLEIQGALEGHGIYTGVKNPMKRLKRCLILMILAVVFSFPLKSTSRSQSWRTDLNLIIAIDCSYSVNKAEFQLQIQGIANALISEDVVMAIKGGQVGRIGVAVFQWAGPDTQEVVIPWTLISSTGEAAQVAQKLLATPRLTAEGVTAIGSALTFGTNFHKQAPFFAERQVIDMQADGTSTWSRGVPIQQARNLAVNNGVVVNGLPILNEVPYLDHYFVNHVIGGPGSFIEVAQNYKSFARAIKRKLLREIRGLPLS